MIEVTDYTLTKEFTCNLCGDKSEIINKSEKQDSHPDGWQIFFKGKIAFCQACNNKLKYDAKEYCDKLEKHVRVLMKDGCKNNIEWGDVIKALLYQLEKSLFNNSYESTRYDLRGLIERYYDGDFDDYILEEE